MSKHPELQGVVRAMGVSYACAYMRLENGWDLPRAVNTPVHIPKPKPVKQDRIRYKRMPEPLMADDRARMHAWQQPGWVHVPHKPRAPHKPRERYVPHTAEDKSPARIRRLRALLCDGFIKTGELDTAILTELKGYADECRASATHPDRVSPEHAARRYGRPRKDDGDHGRGNDHDTDAATARRVFQFLRPE